MILSKNTYLLFNIGNIALQNHRWMRGILKINEGFFNCDFAQHEDGGLLCKWVEKSDHAEFKNFFEDERVVLIKNANLEDLLYL